MPSFPECGVAVTSTMLRSGSAASRRSSSCRWWRKPPRPISAEQVCASSTMRRSGAVRTNSSRRRSDLMKSIETTVYGMTSKMLSSNVQYVRSSRLAVEASTSSASMWNFSLSSACHCSAR